MTAVLALALVTAGCGSSGGAAKPTTPPVSSAPTGVVAPATPTTTTASAAKAHSSHPAPRATAARATVPLHTSARPTPSTRPSPAQRTSLPLALPTGDATRVVTVTAPSTGSTTATLQAWQRTASGWAKVGGPVTAWVGADGLSTSPSESRSATPIGSFTLTQAFGRMANPGTGLPYRQTTPADWWISQSGPLYNTLQHCSGSCGFTQGDPNEHLYYETPYYDYAVVIDYNTRNSPTGVRQGAGSAFFLHVSVGSATAGCVAIPRSALVPLMQWLMPAAHPRILIGVA